MTAQIGNIPVFDAVISDDDCGMLCISLVDAPAVMSDFLAFAEDKQRMNYAVQDEDKRIVRGCVMRADFPIYRRDKAHGEFYIIYTADTIRTMAEKYLAESRQNNVNLMHLPDSFVNGVHMVQYFIKDTANGVNPQGFEDCADGSLIAEFHVVNDGVWAAVKDGTFKGFSLEGVFELAPNERQDEVSEIAETLQGKFSTKHKKMTKLNKIFEALRKALVSAAEELTFGNVTTDKGVLAWDGEDDLKEGDEVFVEDAEGERTPAADGDYLTDDNKTIVVVDGKVAEIRDPEAEVAPEPAAEEENAVAMAEVKTDKAVLVWHTEEDLKEGDEVFVVSEEGEETPAEDGDYTTEDGKVIVVVDGNVAEIKDAEAEVAPEVSEEEVEALRKENAELKATIEKMKKVSAAKPAHEEVTSSVKFSKTGVKGLDTLARIASAK